MNDRKNKPDRPFVEVVHRTVLPKTVTPVSPSTSPRPMGLRPSPSTPFSAPSRSRPPRAAPSLEQVASVAQRERVPARIAKGELEGKMKCRIWRKLHAEEAQRFDQAYELLGKHPGLELADAFGVLQANCTVEAFLARKGKQHQKAEARRARQSLPNASVEALLAQWSHQEADLALVLGERTVFDRITQEAPLTLELERSGPLQKLQVVLLTTRAAWEREGPRLQRDARLSQKPAPVARQPDKRPVNDPRPFMPCVGADVRLLLRNGLLLRMPLLNAGRFDLIVGAQGGEWLVPLHAIVEWTVESAPVTSP